MKRWAFNYLETPIYIGVVKANIELDILLDIIVTNMILNLEILYTSENIAHIATRSFIIDHTES